MVLADDAGRARPPAPSPRGVVDAFAVNSGGRGGTNDDRVAAGREKTDRQDQRASLEVRDRARSLGARPMTGRSL